MCSHQQDFDDSEHNTEWNNSQTQHKQTSHTPIMVQFWMLWFFVRISLTRDPWNTTRRRRRLLWPRVASLGASWGFSWLHVGANSSISDGLTLEGLSKHPQGHAGRCQVGTHGCPRRSCLSWWARSHMVRPAVKWHWAVMSVHGKPACVWGLWVLWPISLLLHPRIPMRSQATVFEVVISYKYSDLLAAAPPGLLPSCGVFCPSLPPGLVPLQLNSDLHLVHIHLPKVQLPSCNAPHVVYSFPWT